MVVDAVKEMMNNGRDVQEVDCRSIAQTCVDSFAFINQGREPSVWETAARRRRADKEGGRLVPNTGQETTIDG